MAIVSVGDMADYLPSMALVGGFIGVLAMVAAVALVGVWLGRRDV